jgi:hypothetical protein
VAAAVVADAVAGVAIDLRLRIMSNAGYWFTSSKFEIETGEDEDINPRMYGRQLAIWLKVQLEKYGYEIEDIINEDWGRCLMCSRDPFMLWIGCGSAPDYETAMPGDPAPNKDEVMWHCFVIAEVFFWKRLFRKIDTTPAVAKLHTDLGSILQAEPTIFLVE